MASSIIRNPEPPPLPTSLRVIIYESNAVAFLCKLSSIQHLVGGSVTSNFDGWDITYDGSEDINNIIIEFINTLAKDKPSE